MARTYQNSGIISGLGGSEAFCLHLKGYTPGHVVVGNSVQSKGMLGSLLAGARNMAGGEVTEVTDIIKSGRDEALGRLEKEAQGFGAAGVSGVTSRLKYFDGHTEFISTGSAIHGPSEEFFTSAFDGKEMFSLLDARYSPRNFAFGNIAYSMGIGGGMVASLRKLSRGEVKEYSDIVNANRHAAHQRLTSEARAAGSNAVLGVEVIFEPFSGVHELLMTGTGAYHPALPSGQVASSDLAVDELWSMAKMGYAPVKIVMGCAVYSVGLVGDIKSMFAAARRGELPQLTSLVYDAREHVMDLLERERRDSGADLVIGTDIYVSEIAEGLVEFLAIGNAMKKMDGMTPLTDNLPAQAVLHNHFSHLG